MFDVYKKENENFINQLFPKNRVRNVFDLFALHKLEDVFECDSSQTVL
jgi:NAD-dependent DNA ligase